MGSATINQAAAAAIMQDEARRARERRRDPKFKARTAEQIAADLEAHARNLMATAAILRGSGK